MWLHFKATQFNGYCYHFDVAQSDNIIRLLLYYIFIQILLKTKYNKILTPLSYQWKVMYIFP